MSNDQERFKMPETATNLKDALSDFANSIPQDLKTAVADLVGTYLDSVSQMHVTFILTSRFGTLKSVAAANASPDKEATFKAYLDGETNALAGDYVRVHMTLNDKVVYYQAYEVNGDRSKLVSVDADRLPEFRNRTV